jgi:hypothetical protein
VDRLFYYHQCYFTRKYRIFTTLCMQTQRFLQIDIDHFAWMPIGCLQFRSCSSSVYCIRSTYDAEYKLICISITQKTYQPRQICHTDRRNNFHVFRFFGGVRVAHLFSFLFCVLFVFVLCLVCPIQCLSVKIFAFAYITLQYKYKVHHQRLVFSCFVLKLVQIYFMYLYCLLNEF